MTNEISWKEYFSLKPRDIGSPRYRHLLLLLYLPVHVLAFAVLERIYPSEAYALVSCAWDQRIPFCELFVIPYVLWFPFWFGMIAYTLRFDIAVYRRLMWYMILCCGFSLLLYAVFPNRAALRAAHDKGVAVAVATGRTLSILGDVCEQVPQIDYILYSNGAAAAKRSGEVLYENALSWPEAERLLDYFDRCPVFLEVYAGGVSYAQADKERFFPHGVFPKIFVEEQGHDGGGKLPRGAAGKTGGKVYRLYPRSGAAARRVERARGRRQPGCDLLVPDQHRRDKGGRRQGRRAAGLTRIAGTFARAVCCLRRRGKRRPHAAGSRHRRRHGQRERRLQGRGGFRDEVQRRRRRGPRAAGAVGPITAKKKRRSWGPFRKEESVFED